MSHIPGGLLAMIFRIARSGVLAVAIASTLSQASHAQAPLPGPATLSSHQQLARDVCTICAGSSGDVEIAFKE